MLYAQVVLGIPVEGPFDYLVPEHLEKKIKVGARVKIGFRTKEALGYVVKLSAKTKIKHLKNIIELIDDLPILDKNLLLLTKALSNYYCCSWGEAIETALPAALRKGKKLTPLSNIESNKLSPVSSTENEGQEFKPEVLLVHDLSGYKRWDIYIPAIKDALSNNKSIIILLPDIKSVFKTKKIISDRFSNVVRVLYRKEIKEAEEWIKILQSQVSIVIGTRSGIFAPVNNLGLVIIDEEQDTVYKQDQVPHYHAREVAFMRRELQKTGLILGSHSPSLESFYLAKESKIKYKFIPPESFPEVKVIDAKAMFPRGKRRDTIASKYLEDAISLTLNLGGKILLFLNRRGFATFVSCRHCGIILKCPRCNINLTYHFKENILNCHYCNFKSSPANICPHCNSGYIRYSGLGTEKIESELSRVFPQARVKRWEGSGKTAIEDADIFISTESIIGETNFSFDLVGILAIDNALNRVDFRSSEKTFGLLTGLMGLTGKRLIIQTSLINHHCFAALQKREINFFYEEELKQRKQLFFPPYRHLGLVKLRGKNEESVRQASKLLFERLEQHNKDKNIKIVSVNAAHPAKLRDNFYWQILLKAVSAQKMTNLLKKYLKDFSHSGIIVTVDVDPL